MICEDSGEEQGQGKKRKEEEEEEEEGKNWETVDK